jgi:hypothetical protein
MTLSIASIVYRWRASLLCAVLCIPAAAYAQIKLTGAVEFGTDSGGRYLEDIWNTYPDANFDLWLSLNADGTSPVNGPADAQSGISIPLQAGNSYRYYLCGADENLVGNYGLNLFFDGNNSTPAISVYGELHNPAFASNINATLTLAGALVPGSGRTFYTADGVTVVLNGYGYYMSNADNCQGLVFTPGGSFSFSGSFSLQAGKAAHLDFGKQNAVPQTRIVAVGSGFAALETVSIYPYRIGSPPIGSTTTDANGSFAFRLGVPIYSYGNFELFAVGQASGAIGASVLSITPGLFASPEAGAPGSSTTITCVGFGSGENVDVYWKKTQELLGSAVASSQGTASVAATIPLNAVAGVDEIIGVGQTTNATGFGKVTVD